MAQASRKSVRSSGWTVQLGRGLREAALFLFGALALYLFVALASYDANDPGWSHSATGAQVANLGGVAGAWFADAILYLLGYMAYLLPVLVGYWGWMVFRGEGQDGSISKPARWLRLAGFFLTLGAGSGLAKLHFTTAAGVLPLDAGGVLGNVVGAALVGAFSMLGATLFLLALFLGGVTLFTSLSWLWAMEATGRQTLRLLAWSRVQWGVWSDRLAGWRARRARQEVVEVEKKKVESRPPPRIEIPPPPVDKPSKRVEQERQALLFEPPADAALPALALLDPATPSKNAISKSDLEAMSRLVEIKLRDFGVEAEVVAVHPGPVITRFELQPAPGVKVSQISNLAKDLARSLSAVSVRVVEVIPGKTTVGLEIPNQHRELVRLSEVLKSQEYEATASPLSLALGKDISGQPVVADLARMPHLLVAGTTGSGKSVAVNAMVLSLLYKASARDVRMIMIDPKMLELSVYEGIPHLLAPVVTDMKEAANALRWCVAEMERRYRIMASLGVRNIGGYNRRIQDAKDKGEILLDPLTPQGLEPRALDSLPYIVVIIDELADMMMVVGKKVEELIARLAQKARAAGIHLILATQRPSVDVITGLIKANIPTRIAFQVSSKIDSRTILDQMGAEQLLGHGDMLYLPPGTGLPIRVHGAFVDDHEVHRVAQDLKRRGAPDYLEEILSGGAGEEGGTAGEPGVGEGEQDPLYDQALRIVTETRRASISAVQRRLKVGYNRAARMIEEMERAGVVGPLQANGSREVLAPPPPEL